MSSENNNDPSHLEARRIIGNIRAAIFEQGNPSVTITKAEYWSLRTALAEDRAEVSFTPLRTGIVAVAFGGDIIV